VTVHFDPSSIDGEQLCLMKYLSSVGDTQAGWSVRDKNLLSGKIKAIAQSAAFDRPNRLLEFAENALANQPPAEPG